MMQDSPDMEGGHNPSQSDLSMLSLDVQRVSGSPSFERSECPLMEGNSQLFIMLHSLVMCPFHNFENA